MRAINKLKKEDHLVIEKIIKMVNGETETVQENYFQTTPFLTETGFMNSQKMIGDFLVGYVSKPMIETPLIGERGNQAITYTGPKGKGMGFGLILIDYRTKAPLLSLYVDKTATGYSYESARFENGAWVNGINANFNATSQKEFLEDVAENLDTDVRWFTDKY
jgi:hypothetical protein